MGLEGTRSTERLRNRDWTGYGRKRAKNISILVSVSYNHF